MSIKACELMVEAQKNPEKYEGKRYKGEPIRDGAGKDYSELYVEDGKLLAGDSLWAYVNSYTQLEEIKPETKPVTFIEAAKSYKKLKYNHWAKFYTLNEVLEILSEKAQSSINEMLFSRQWYIEE